MGSLITDKATCGSGCCVTTGRLRHHAIDRLSSDAAAKNTELSNTYLHYLHNVKYYPRNF